MPDTLQADLDALNRFIVDCQELETLEALLGGFNLFQVLKFEYGEIRHSNVLAWLLDPAESHGLGRMFLQRLLMRILHESDKATDITPVDIDCWQSLTVEIRREWNHIDLLCLITLASGDTWVICIENKVKSQQHSNQLHRYRKLVEETFPDAERRLYILLSKDGEEPEDDEYHIADYGQVHKTLKDCVASREHAIGSEPKVLIENYLRLLEEKFMNESDIARTARMIYQQHKRALDIIIEHRPDMIREISEALVALIENHAAERDIIPVKSERQWIRFIPSRWDQPGNRHSSALRGIIQSVSLEISLAGDSACLIIAAWKNPELWIDRLWERTASKPYTRPAKPIKRPKHNWCHLHSHNLKVNLTNLEPDQDAAAIAQEIFSKAMVALKSEQMQQAIQDMADQLPSLDEAFLAEKP